jgi:hypothetical protein
MMNAFPGILTGLVGLVPLIAQWIGLMAMRDQRTGAWWTMITGTTIQTLGTLGVAVAMTLMFTVLGASGGNSPDTLIRYSSVMMFTGLAAGGGSLLFAVGFAIHGLSRRAGREREQQLEAMTATMAEELRVLRERAG